MNPEDEEFREADAILSQGLKDEVLMDLFDVRHVLSHLRSTPQAMFLIGERVQPHSSSPQNALQVASTSSWRGSRERPYKLFACRTWSLKHISDQAARCGLHRGCWPSAFTHTCFKSHPLSQQFPNVSVSHFKKGRVPSLTAPQSHQC